MQALSPIAGRIDAMMGILQALLGIMHGANDEH